MYNSLLIVSAGSSSSGGGLWCAPLGCVDLAAAAVALLAGTSALAVLVSGTLLYLSGARDAVERERERTRAEREAFARFTRRVSRLEPAGAGAGGVPDTTGRRPDGGTAGPAVGPLARAGASDDRLERAREAYRETVMAVPHYEEEYGGSLAEDVAAEFGEEVAAGVVEGDRFTPELKAALVRGSETARGEREAFLRALDREDDALARAAGTFSDLLSDLERRDARPLTAKSLDELAADWDRIADLRAECTRVLADRQERIHAGYPSLPREGGVGFHRYLYRALPVTHPVLAEGAALSATLRTAQRRILGTAIRRA